MENTVFERNYEIVEKDDRATAVFERAFAPGGFMEEFIKKMDAIPKVVVPKDKENYEYLLDRCDDYAKRHHGRIRGVVDYEHWDAHIDLYLRMLEFDDAEDKLKQTIDRCIITAKDYDEFLKLMQEAGYEIKTGKYIYFRAEGQERFTRAKTIGDNYTEERIKERIQGRGNRKRQMQTSRRGISLISDIQERIQLIGSKGYEHKAKLTILKEAARTLNYLTENNLLQYADLEKKVEDIHSSYGRTGSELKNVEAKLREVQPLIKNISNYQRLKPVYDAYMKAADKPAYRAKHEAELVIYEAAKSTLLAIQGDGKLPSLKSLQAEQQRLADEQQRLYDERAKLKKEARLIDTMKANVDDFLSPSMAKEQEKSRSGELE